MLSDHGLGRNSNSKSNLIEVQHVGVTAKLQSPLKTLLQISSSESDNGKRMSVSQSKYEKLFTDSQVESTTTESSRMLYELRTTKNQKIVNSKFNKINPSKIEFQLYKRPQRYPCKHKSCKNPLKKRFRRKPNRNQSRTAFRHECNRAQQPSFFQRLFNAFQKMRAAQSESNIQASKVQSCPFGSPIQRKAPPPPNDEIGIYYFEHGNSNYLRTTDKPPTLITVLLADRATVYATRFWAEVFGSLHIGVIFLATFFLQTYRFALYSLVNTLLVGFLSMTSDYFIKPLMTVLFNGFLQPPLILVFNILKSFRDLLAPVADTFNNFMKPFATLGESLRLVNVNCNNRKLIKEV